MAKERCFYFIRADAGQFKKFSITFKFVRTLLQITEFGSDVLRIKMVKFRQNYLVLVAVEKEERPKAKRLQWTNCFA